MKRDLSPEPDAAPAKTAAALVKAPFHNAGILLKDQHSGPVVWSGIIAATCALLFLLEQMLWLAVPFLLGIILYYILLGPMQRLIRAGVSHNTAAMLVG